MVHFGASVGVSFGSPEQQNCLFIYSLCEYWLKCYGSKKWTVYDFAAAMLVETCLKLGQRKGLFGQKACLVKKSFWPMSVWLKSQFSHKSVQPATPLPHPHPITCLWSPILALNIIQKRFIRRYCDSYYISFARRAPVHRG